MCVSRICGFIFVSLALLIGVRADFCETRPIADLVGEMDKLTSTINAEVTRAMKGSAQTGSYTTVWRAHEDAAIVALTEVLTNHIAGLTGRDFDAGTKGSEKNRLADLAIVCGGKTIEISIKSARHSQNPENDLGTFHEYPNRKKTFIASYTLWVRYDDEEGERIHVDRAFFDRSYRSVGKSTLVDGVKYRKKDGNMRPKPWSMFDADKSYWNTEAEFEAAIQRSERYRASQLVKEHLQDLSESDQRLLYEQLKRKFGDSP